MRRGVGRWLDGFNMSLRAPILMFALPAQQHLINVKLVTSLSRLADGLMISEVNNVLEKSGEKGNDSVMKNAMSH